MPKRVQRSQRTKEVLNKAYSLTRKRILDLKDAGLLPISSSETDDLVYQRTEFVGDAILKVETMKKLNKMFPFMNSWVLENLTMYSNENALLTRVFKSCDLMSVFPQVPRFDTNHNYNKCYADAIETLIGELHGLLKRRINPTITTRVRSTLSGLFELIIFECLPSFMYLEQPRLLPDPPIRSFPSQIRKVLPVVAPGTQPKEPILGPSDFDPLKKEEEEEEKEKEKEKKKSNNNNSSRNNSMKLPDTQPKEPILGPSDFDALLSKKEKEEEGEKGKVTTGPAAGSEDEPILGASDFDALLFGKKEKKKSNNNSSRNNSMKLPGTQPKEPILGPSDFDALLSKKEKEEEDEKKSAAGKTAPEDEPILGASDFDALLFGKKEKKNNSNNNSRNLPDTQPKEPILGPSDFDTLLSKKEKEEEEEEKKPEKEVATVTKKKEEETVTAITAQQQQQQQKESLLTPSYFMSLLDKKEEEEEEAAPLPLPPTPPIPPITGTAAAQKMKKGRKRVKSSSPVLAAVSMVTGDNVKVKKSPAESPAENHGDMFPPLPLSPSPVSTPSSSLVKNNNNSPWGSPKTHKSITETPPPPPPSVHSSSSKPPKYSPEYFKQQLENYKK